MIDVTGLEVAFGDGVARHLAVAGVDFSVATGAAFGIVGESGSGKSTVLRALCGLTRPTAGRVLVDGVPPRPGHGTAVQMVFQDPSGSLHPRQCVHDQLAEPLRIHRRPGIEDAVTRALVEVGLDPGHRWRFPHQLSGGQRQRVAIARALILSPSVLLLDEPTSALDVSVQAEIVNLVRDLATRRGLTLVTVGHDLAVVAHLAPRIAVMQAGRIVETIDRAVLPDGPFAHAYTRDLVTAARRYETGRAAATGNLSSCT